MANRAPAFDPLPDLRVSATGPLTAFAPPPVRALDQVDGEIAAEANPKGPFATGEHSIRWTAKNTADVYATAVQKLYVVDVTAPEVVAPPDITVAATGLFTRVELGQAVAIDREEGPLKPSSDSEGLFGVGTHAITWIAIDRAGNKGTATQRVTVTGDVPPALAISRTNESSFEDIELTDLPALPDARFAGTPLVEPARQEASRRADTSPASPYDDLDDGVVWTRVDVPAVPADGARDYLVLAIAESATASLRLFVGGEGEGAIPTSASQRCARSSAARLQNCEIRVTREAGAPATNYWALAQNVSGGADGSDSVSIRLAAVPMIPDNQMLVATGPGHVALGQSFDYRLAWDDPSWLPGEERVGYVFVYSRPGELVYYEPVWLRRGVGENAPHLLTSGNERRVRLAPGKAQDRLYLDVPSNAESVVFRMEGDGNVDLYATHLADPTGPDIAAAHWQDSAITSARGSGASKVLTLKGDQLLPGRWYLTPVNAGDEIADVIVSASIEGRGAAPQLRPGHYYNPSRSGLGLFLDFAGEQWAMVWYAYLEDGTPTWYVAQNRALDGTEAQWTSPLYRVAWNGNAAHSTRVGLVQLSIQPDPEDAAPKLVMSFNLDGASGWEPLTRLGNDECPVLGGKVLDASGHWYSPALPGFGYSVLFQRNTEAHVVYLYDDVGFPRWLIAQKPYEPDIGRIDMVQFTGFCPTCAAKPPKYVGVGQLTRYLDEVTGEDGRPGLMRIEVDAELAEPLSGQWRTNLPVHLLTARMGCSNSVQSH